MTPVGCTASPKSRPCWIAFCPTVPSSTSSVSCGAPGTFRVDDARHLPELVHQVVLGVQATGGVDDARCRARAPSRPRSHRRPPPPGRRPACLQRTPRRSAAAQTCSCDTAPARQVSAAASSTLRPSPLSRCASFATVVVFPTPFTPTTRMTVGPLVARAIRSGCSGPSQHRREAVDQGPRTSSSFLSLPERTPCSSASTSSMVAGTPKSASMQQLLDLLEIRGLEPAHQRAHVGEHDALEAAPQTELLLAYATECHD